MDCAQASLALKRDLKPQEVSLYVGIPFCPTRCAYCSFISSSGRPTGSSPTIWGLHREIDAAGKALREGGEDRPHGVHRRRHPHHPEAPS